MNDPEHALTRRSQADVLAEARRIVEDRRMCEELVGTQMSSAELVEVALDAAYRSIFEAYYNDGLFPDA